MLHFMDALQYKHCDVTTVQRREKQHGMINLIVSQITTGYRILQLERLMPLLLSISISSIDARTLITFPVHILISLLNIQNALAAGSDSDDDAPGSSATSFCF